MRQFQAMSKSMFTFVASAVVILDWKEAGSFFNVTAAERHLLALTKTVSALPDDKVTEETVALWPTVSAGASICTEPPPL